MRGRRIARASRTALRGAAAACSAGGEEADSEPCSRGYGRVGWSTGSSSPARSGRFLNGSCCAWCGTRGRNGRTLRRLSVSRRTSPRTSRRPAAPVTTARRGRHRSRPAPRPPTRPHRAPRLPSPTAPSPTPAPTPPRGCSAAPESSSPPAEAHSWPPADAVRTTPTTTPAPRGRARLLDEEPSPPNGRTGDPSGPLDHGRGGGRRVISRAGSWRTTSRRSSSR